MGPGLYNLELTLRSDALEIAKVVDQEARTLRAQPFARSSLFGPAAILASSQRILEDRAINEARKEVQKKSSSRSNKRPASQRAPSQRRPSDFHRAAPSSGNRAHRSSSVAAAAAVVKKYEKKVEKKDKRQTHKSNRSKSRPFSLNRSKNSSRGPRPAGKGPQ